MNILRLYLKFEYNFKEQQNKKKKLSYIYSHYRSNTVKQTI